MSLVDLRHLGVTLGGRAVVRDASLSIGPGEVLGLIGPNGAGKSTLMRAALGLVAHRGHSSLAALAPEARARAVAWLPQSREIAWPMSVAALVGLGRLPHSVPGSVEDALQRMDVTHLRHRPATALSGGEAARVLIARALAQDTPLLLADEPAAGLDPAHQLGVMQTFRALAAEGRGVGVALHDLGLALRFCTRLVVMDRDGRIAADGPPDRVLTPALLSAVFGIEALIATIDGHRLLTPIAVSRAADSTP